MQSKFVEVKYYNDEGHYHYQTIDEITRYEDVESLTFYNTRHYVGLEFYINLRRLSFEHCNINAFRVFPFFEKLESFRCINNNIENLYFLRNCVNLVQIDVSYNYLKNLGGLQNMRKLEYLTCCTNYIESLKEIQNCTNMIYLDCRKNLIENLQGLENFDKLRVLFCDYNLIDDLSAIKNCKSLQALHCKNNQLQKLDDIVNLELNLSEIESDILN